MSTNAHNQPAFASAAMTNNNWHFQHGMTLRQYFAARAPHEIPAWIEPVMPPEPEEKWLDQDTGEEAEEYETQSDEFKITKAMAGIALAAKRNGLFFDNVNAKAQEAWRKAYQIQRFAQWPWFWADMVIGAQDTKVDAPKGKPERTEQDEHRADAIEQIRDYIMQVEPTETSAEDIRDRVHRFLKDYGFAV